MSVKSDEELADSRRVLTSLGSTVAVEGTILQQADSYILHTGLSLEIHGKEKQFREKKNKTLNWSLG